MRLRTAFFVCQLIGFLAFAQCRSIYNADRETVRRGEEEEIEKLKDEYYRKKGEFDVEQQQADAEQKIVLNNLSNTVNNVNSFQKTNVADTITALQEQSSKAKSVISLSETSSRQQKESKRAGKKRMKML